MRDYKLGQYETQVYYENLYYSSGVILWMLVVLNREYTLSKSVLRNDRVENIIERSGAISVRRRSIDAHLSINMLMIMTVSVENIFRGNPPLIVTHHQTDTSEHTGQLYISLHSTIKPIAGGNQRLFVFWHSSSVL